VERNALRGKLVDRAEDWQWWSLWRRKRGTLEQRRWLGRWPLPLGWLELVNKPQNESELEALRRCGKRGQPLGDADWVASTAKELGLESTLKPRARPRKADPASEYMDLSPFEAPQNRHLLLLWRTQPLPTIKPDGPL
jgi:putative transposase